MFERYCRSRFITSPMGFLWVDAAAGAAAAGGDGGDKGAAAGGDGGDKGAAAAAAGGSEKTYSFKEDRTNWVDPEKHKKAELLVNRTAQELERLKSEIATRDKRIQALAGVTPPDPDAAEAEKIAAAFFALPQFAHLKGITPQLVTQVQALIANGESITAARDHVWNQHTDKFLGDLDAEFAAEIGTDKLTPGQQRKLHAAFDAMVPDERADPEAFATFKKRFEQLDPTLIADFVKEYVSDMLEPARRQATVPITQRPRVPRSGGAQPVVAQVPKPDYSKMSVPEMLDAAEKLAEASGR